MFSTSLFFKNRINLNLILYLNKLQLLKGLCFTAMYAYEANDTDEASIEEGDRIVDCEVVDEGWINGTVERTGQRGLIPKNYVEPA